MFNTVQGLFATTVAAAMIVYFFTLPLNWRGAWKLVVWCWENWL